MADIYNTYIAIHQNHYLFTIFFFIFLGRCFGLGWGRWKHIVWRDLFLYAPFTKWDDLWLAGKE